LDTQGQLQRQDGLCQGPRRDASAALRQSSATFSSSFSTHRQPGRVDWRGAGAFRLPACIGRLDGVRLPGGSFKWSQTDL